MTNLPVRRAATMGAALLLALAGIGVRLGYVQGVKANDYAAEARRQTVRKIDLPARRGTIFDRAGGELAVSVPARTIYANPRFAKDPVAMARQLAPLLKKDVADVERDLRKDSGFVYLARRVGIVTADKVMKLGLPGIGTLDEARRLYPGGTLASNVIGFIGTDQTGLGGLEYAYDKLLSGQPGFRILEQDPRGRRIPQGKFTEVKPVPGSDITLTIDPDIQFAAERALGEAVERTEAKGGMVVALDPRTGEILAMVSNPGFDPNAISGIDVNQTRNKVVTDSYEPGSISKIIVASAALSEGLLKPDQKIYVPGSIRIGPKTFSDERTKAGSYDLRWIIAHSSNVGTIRVAQMLGAKNLEPYFSRLGYGKSTGLGFPGESAGNLPKIGRWSTSLPTMAIGQSLAVTPLQLAQAYAMVANDGVMMEPRLVSSWVDPKGGHHEPSAPRSRRVLDADVARTLRSIFRSVVVEGTGRNAAIPGIEVAGKTGTASKIVPGVGYQGYFASFMGMLPASDPRIVIGVVLDDPTPNEGGLAAAPAFSQIAKDVVRIMRIQPAD